MRRQQGFSLITAIFVVVVLASLGGYMVTISTSQHYTAMNAQQAARAYAAARSGIEWAVAEALTAVDCDTTPVNGATPAFPDYADFTVTIACTDDGNQTHNETGNPANDYMVFTVTATALPIALSLGDRGFAARSLTVTFTNAP